MKVLSLVFIVLVLGYTSALTDEQAMLKLAKYVQECAVGKRVDLPDLLKLIDLEVPTKPEVKCVLACTHRKIGTLKSDGMYDIEGMYKFAEECKEGDEKRLENGKKVADICIKVNEETVSDGDKGCDRAALMFNCIVTHAPKLGFNIKLDPTKVIASIKM